MPLYQSMVDDDEPEKDMELLNKLGRFLMTSRAEAIRGRKETGIEDNWRQDEEFYEGIDDANRGEMSAWQGKPLGQAALSDGGTGSTVFLNITRSYCDAASARTGDVLLPTDDRAWAMKNTPVVELIPLAEGDIPDEVKGQVREAQTNPETGEVDEAGVEKTEEEIVAFAKQEVDKASKALEKATKRIDDWHVESQYHAEVRKVLDDTSRVGSGVLKGPIPKKKRQVAFIDNAIVIKEEIKPVSAHVSFWNFYPDPGCGSNIHDGAYTWERDDIGIKTLAALRGTPGYITSQIQTVLEQGAHSAVHYSGSSEVERPEVAGLSPRDTKNMFEIWYYHGSISREDMEAAGCECPEDKPFVDAQVTLVNNVVIKAVLNPLDTGAFPYDVMVWQGRHGMPWGIGVGRQMRPAQKIVNGAARNMMDNAGRASGPQVVVQTGIVQPEDGIFEITPWKIWIAGEDAETHGLDNAFRFVAVDMLQPQLQSIVDMGMRLAEDTTGLPLIMQGQTAASTPETLGGMQLQNSNASTVLRRVARLFDDLITEPHIRRYYNYLLQYGEDDEKGEFVIDARGSSALVERDNNSQELMQLGDMVMNPVFGLDPKKWLEEYLKSRRIDVRKLEYDDEQWKGIVENMSQPPPPPPDTSIDVAKIRADNAVKLQEMSDKERALDRNARSEIAAYKIDTEKGIAQAKEEAKALAGKMMADMESLKLRGHKEAALEKIKADLSKLVLTLRMQEKLSDGPGGEVAKPAVEPPGVAEPGQGFAQ